MSDKPALPEAMLARLRWPVRLTRLGLLAERLTQCFWPVWTILFLMAAAAAFHLEDMAGVEIAWAGLMFGLGGLCWGLWDGIRKFRWPSHADALERLDRTLPGRPLAALSDTQAVGAGDSASAEVWRAHQSRMAARAAGAKAVEPDLRLARRDPFALRYVALLVFLMAVGFGSVWSMAGFGPMPGSAAAVAAGPAWEGWVQPPAYTGKPSFYLNDIAQPSIDVPQGSHITLRLYGQVGALTVAETVSGRTGDLGSASAAQQEFAVTRSGSLAISGRNGRSWNIAMIPDKPPTVAIVSPPERKADGKLDLAFHATDDYGVVKGKATINLDLAKVDRIYGLTVAPEPRQPIVLDLPMPINGKRTDFTGVLSDDLQKSPWANLPVTIQLTVQDALGQTGTSAVMTTDLPGRRFFDPLAAAVIEMRRDLLWSTANAERVDEVLRAVTWKPEGFIKNQKAYLLLRVAMKRLEVGMSEGLTTEVRDEVAEALWQVGVEIEKGTVSDALDRLHQAQDRLSEAIRRGASKDEIAKLMQDLNKALENYVARLAEQGQQNGDQQQMSQNGQMITGDQMQQMLDRLQQLMQQGKMAEAQQLLDRLRQLTENMQVAQGQNGMQIPGGKAMQGLTDTLRKQQQLSDNTFQDLQRQFQQGQGQPGQQGQGQQQGTGQQGEGGQDGQDQAQGLGQNQQPGQGQGADGQSLADRQAQLQKELQGQSQGQLPGDGTQNGRDARDALGRAARAMNGAEQALRQGDNAGALDRQAEAMDALRQGLHSMDQAMAAQQGQQTGSAEQGQADGSTRGMSDPLGRQVGQAGAMGTPQNMLQGDDVYRRAREILDELRKRAGDSSRSSFERDYLKRLLDVF